MAHHLAALCGLQCTILHRPRRASPWVSGQHATGSAHSCCSSRSPRSRSSCIIFPRKLQQEAEPSEAEGPKQESYRLPAPGPACPCRRYDRVKARLGSVAPCVCVSVSRYRCMQCDWLTTRCARLSALSGQADAGGRPGARGRPGRPARAARLRAGGDVAYPPGAPCRRWCRRCRRRGRFYLPATRADIHLARG